MTPSHARPAARLDGEVLTGAHAGWVLSREIRLSRAPTLLSEAEGNIAQGRQREPSGGPCAVADPMHVWNLLAREPGDPIDARRRWCGGPRRKG